MRRRLYDKDSIPAWVWTGIDIDGPLHAYSPGSKSHFQNYEEAL